MTADAAPATEVPTDDRPKRIVISEDLALTTLVAVATTIVMTELGFGHVSAAVGVAASALLSDLLKNYLVRRRVGKKPLVLVTLLLLALSTVRDAFGAIGRRVGVGGGRRRRERRRPRSHSTPGARASFEWRGALATSALATAVTVGLFTAPELAVGKSLLIDRRTTFFSVGTRPDHEPPALSLPAGRTVLSERPTPVAYTVSAVDRRDGQVHAACSPPPGAVFRLGMTRVRCVAADRHGNRATGAFTVTVQSTGGSVSKPTLDLPRRLAFEAHGALGARVRYAASARDSDGNALEARCNRPSGALFPIGTTSVTCRTVDGGGRTARGAFTVIVRDTRPPQLTVPEDVESVAGAASGRPVTYVASARDAVDGAIAPRCSPPSGATFPVGTSTVTCTATDAHGNRSRRQFTVTLRLVRDVEAPILRVADGRAEATSAAGARVAYTATATDDVDGPVPTRCSPASGSTFGLGTTTVHCSARDSAGNRVSATSQVTVVDTRPPDLDLPARQTVEATSAAGARVDFDVAAVDRVDGEVKATCSPAPGTTFPIGTTSVSCSAADRRGNGVSGTFDVTVQDTTGPALELPHDLRVEARSARGAKVSFTVSATDVVSGPVTPTCSRRPGLFPLGTTVVSCSAVDERGNPSEGSFRVNVVDTRAPRLSLPGDFRVEAVWNAKMRLYLAVIAYTASAWDAVDGRVETTCEPASGYVFTAKATGADAVYPVVVNCSAVDAHGNRAGGHFTVTVVVSVVE